MRLRKYFSNPENRARVHIWLSIFWIIMIVPTILWWKTSIEYLVAISLYAIIMGHISSSEANKAEIITKKQIEGEFDDINTGQETLEELLDRHEKT